MIRPARFQDVPALMALLRRAYDVSKYAGRMDVCDKASDQLFMGLVAGMTQQGPGATHLTVAVNKEGVIVGFIAGVLNRVYHVGTKLAAEDVFFINEGVMRDTLELVDAYIAWASANPKVLMIGLSWSDAIPGAAKIATLAKRKGFEKVGEMFELRMDAVAAMEAA